MTTSKKRSTPRHGIFLKRAYDAPEAKDGTRILVDALWPRGLRKDKAEIDAWLKEIAPSAELRRWFHHDPARWPEFQRRYRNELLSKTDTLDELRRLAGRGPVTLIFAARDIAHNNAVVLESVLRRRG